MVTQVNPKTLTLGDLINQFARRPTLAKRTQQFYTDILSKFEWYARSHLRDFINYVRNEKHRWLEGWRSWYKPAASATVHHYAVAVKGLFNWAEDEEYIERSPAQRMKLVPPGYKEVEPYSDEEVQALPQLCEDDDGFRYRYLGIRNKAIISLFVIIVDQFLKAFIWGEVLVSLGVSIWKACSLGSVASSGITRRLEDKSSMTNGLCPMATPRPAVAAASA